MADMAHISGLVATGVSVCMREMLKRGSGKEREKE